MKILVTGGAGFIGSHLVDALSQDPSNIILVFDNFHRGKRDNIKTPLQDRKVKLIVGDVRDYSSLKKIGKIDFVYHLAAQSNVIGSSLDPNYAFGSNVDGTFNILRYASENNVKGFVFSSSREVYGNPAYLPVDEEHPLDPINIYGATKASGEMLCKAFIKTKNLNITILRMANVYGPRDKDRVIPIFWENAANNKDLKLFGGKQVLDFIWIGDVVKSITEISKNNKFIGETVNIGTGIGTSIEDLAKRIIKMTGSKSKVIRKKPRSIDVENFIAKSNKFKLRTLRLDVGLKKMLND
tara:strand:- start:2891 stop:3781 length:891 start_codon:yes stop_codon:yes gene_type:complete